MNYKDYTDARDAAWQILIRYGIRELPVRLSPGIRRSGIVMTSYREGERLISQLGAKWFSKGNDGFAVRNGTQYYIFYRGDMTAGRIRFTVAHELGHIVLGHLGQGYTGRNREPEPSDAPIEQSANVFASRVLAPACVLNALGADTPEKISKLCDISLASAKFRAERMGLLRSRNAFGLSPLERRVMRQFADFCRR